MEWDVGDTRDILSDDQKSVLDKLLVIAEEIDCNSPGMTDEDDPFVGSNEDYDLWADLLDHPENYKSISKFTRQESLDLLADPDFQKRVLNDFSIKHTRKNAIFSEEKIKPHHLTWDEMDMFLYGRKRLVRYMFRQYPDQKYDLLITDVTPSCHTVDGKRVQRNYNGVLDKSYGGNLFSD